jgi:Rrf2 family protein
MKILALSEANILSYHSMAMIAASGDKGLSAQKIAQSTNSSRHHLFKVLETLAKSGLIYSTRGPAGGYHLNKPADAIYLLDIYESLNGKIDENNLCFGKANSELSFVIFENLCKELSYKFLNYLKTTKLSDIKDNAKIF